MPEAERRKPFELAVTVLTAALVVAFAAGSSSVVDVNRVGRPLRWVVLVALLAVAGLAAVARRRVPLLPRSVVVAGVALLGLAALSTAWSVAPRLTFERFVSVGLLVAAAILVAAVSDDRERAERVLVGLVVGAIVVALLGLLVLAVAYGDAKEGPSIEIPWRYRGFGENPNTDSLLFAVVLPLAVYLALRGRRLLGGSAVILLGGSIVATGSRGALLAAAAGSLVVAALLPSSRRRALAASGAVVVCAAVAVAVQSIPQPTPITPPPPGAAAATPAKPTPPPRYVNVDQVYPLDMDVGRPLPGGGEPIVRRTFLGTSGRAQAWVGAIHQVLQRPLLGFGFGTEARVFVDRYYRFEGGVPENAYIGIALQLGLVGLVALLAVFLVLAVSGLRSLRTPARPVLAACLGVLVAGLVAAVVQSFVYSAGDIAAGTFWIAAFLLATLAAGASRA